MKNKGNLELLMQKTIEKINELNEDDEYYIPNLEAIVESQMENMNEELRFMYLFELRLWISNSWVDVIWDEEKRENFIKGLNERKERILTNCFITNLFYMSNLLDKWGFAVICKCLNRWNRRFVLEEINNDLIRERVLEAMQYVEKWGGVLPQSISDLQEYYKIKPRFELSAIYKEAERVEQEKANETNYQKRTETANFEHQTKKADKVLKYNLNYSREQINRVFEVLVNCDCVRNDEKVKNDLFDVFCSEDTATLQDVKIEWLGNINKLSALIRKVCMIKGKGDICMWKIGERYFVKDGKPILNNALSDGGQKDSKAIEQFEKAIENACK